MDVGAITESLKDTSLSTSDESSSNELPDVREKPKVGPKTKSKYKDMIVDAVSTLNERKGSSRQAILKYLCENYEMDKENKGALTRIRSSLAQLVEDGVLLNPSGRGANGSFKMASKKPVQKKTIAKETVLKDKLVKNDVADSSSDPQKPPAKAKATLALKPKRNTLRSVLTPLSARKSKVVKKKTAITKVAAESSDIEVHGDEKKTKSKKPAKTTEEPIKKVTKSKKAAAPASSPEEQSTTSPAKAQTKSRAKAAKSIEENQVIKEAAAKSPKKPVTKKSPKKAAPKKAKGKVLTKKSN